MRYEIKKLAELNIQVIDGDRGENYPHKEELYAKGDCLFLSANNVTKDGFRFDELQFITKEKDEILRGGKLQRGDVVITTRGTVGNVGYYDDSVPYDNMRINSGMLIVRCGEGISSQYLYYVFKSDWFVNQMRSVQSGSAQPQLPKSHFLKMYIPYPMFIVQQQIVALLDCIDDKIELNNAINHNLQQQAQALYHRIFCASSRSNWQKGILSDIATVIMGQSPSGKSYNESGIGTVFYQGRAEFGSRFPTQRLYTTEPKRMAKEHDILISVRAPVGDLNVAKEDCCIGRGLGAIRSKDGHQSFVLYTMFALQPQLEVFNGEGTVFGSISRDSLNSIPIIIPPIAEIDKFEALVAPMDSAIRANYDEICSLQAIRDSLLPKLMSGEIDVSEVEI